MGFGSFFSLPKPKKFNYIPRYYDPEKEEREKRRSELRAMRGESDGDYIDEKDGKKRTIRFRKQRTRNNSNMRVLIILAALLLLTYFMFR